jgi:nitrogen fixation protein FixH
VPTDARERRFEPWPLALAAALLCMIASSLAFYAIARLHPDALVVQDAYEAGLRYNALQAQRRAAEQRGLDIRLEAELVAGSARLRARVVDEQGGPVSARTIVVRRERPAEGGYDAEFALVRDESGFVGEVPLPRSGRWRLVITAVVDDLRVRRVYRVQG